MSFWDTIVGKGIRVATDPMTGLNNLINRGDVFKDQGTPMPEVDPSTANGGQLDTTLLDEDRKQQQAIIQQLQNQAQNGDPVALQQLKDATQKSMQQGSALSATSAAQHGMGAGSALRSSADQQALTAQKAIGQEQILKAQSQQEAQKQLATLTGQQRASDIAEIQAKLQAQRGIENANIADKEQKAKQFQGMSGGLLQGMLSKVAHGGRIDGPALAPGDDERNDIVPAMLSPGEIVLPRSVTQSSHPEERAAGFVAAVRAGHGPKTHFDEGGPVHMGSGLNTGLGIGLGLLGAPNTDWNKTLNTGASSFGMNPADQAHMKHTDIDAANANAARQQAQGVQAMLDAQAQGKGPSPIQAQLQQATDANLAEAMTRQAQAGQGAGQLGVNAQTTAGAQKLAAESAAAKGDEVAKAQMLNSALTGELRNQSLNQAQLQQRANLEETLVNMGLDAAHRAQVIGQVGGLGAGFASAGAGGMLGGKGKTGAEDTTYEGGASQWNEDINTSGNAGDSMEGGDVTNEAPVDSNTTLPDTGDSGPAYAAHGGQIPFPKALRQHFAEGGYATAWQQPQEAPSIFTQPTGTFAPPQPTLRDRLGNAASTAYDVGRNVYQAGQGALMDAYDAATNPLGPGVGVLNQLAKARKAGPVTTDTGQPVSDLIAQKAKEVVQETAPDLFGKPGSDKPAEKKSGAKPFAEEEFGTKAPQAAQGAGGSMASVSGGVPVTSLAGVDAAQKRLNEAAGVEGQQAEKAGQQKAAVLDQQAQELAQRELATTQLRNDYALHRKEQEDKLNEAMNKFANAEVDPSHFWATKSTGDKILAGIGLALSGLAAPSTGGVNQAVSIINHAIDRDIDAQKANLAKKGQEVQHQSSMLNNLRSNFNDDAQAEAAAKMAYLQRAQTMLAAQDARTQGEAQKAQLAKVNAQLELQKEQWRATFNQQAQFHAQQMALAKAKAGAAPALDVHQQAQDAFDRFEEKYPAGKGSLTNPIEYGRDRQALINEVGGLLSSKGAPKESVLKALDESLPGRAAREESHAEGMRRARNVTRGMLIGKQTSKGGGAPGEAEE